MPFIGCLIGVTIVMGVLRFLFQVAFETASQGVLYDMRDKVYRKLLEEDFAFYNKKRTGDLMSRQTGDMDAIRHFVAYVVYMVYQSVLMFVFALLYDLYRQYKTGTCHACGTAVYCICNLSSDKRGTSGIQAQP